jgi:hypothetical protein
MAGLLLNGLPMLEATWSIPRIGAWSFEGSLHSESDLSGLVTITMPDAGALSWQGTITATQRFYDTVKVRVAPGVGGLTKVPKAKHYQNTTAGVVLQELLAAAGEKLDGSSAPQSRRLESWTVTAGTAARPNTIGASLRALVEEKAGLSWRSLPSGKIWVGQEKWPSTSLAEADYDVLARDGDTGVVQYRVARPELLPGTVIAGDRIGHVEMRLSPGGFLAAGTVDVGGGSPLHNEFKRLVKGVLPAIDYQAHYFARVDAQRSATRVDVTPEDARMPRMPNVRLLTGTAGTGALFNAAGARVLVGWSGGDPEKPYAMAFDQGETVVRAWHKAARLEWGDIGAQNAVVKFNELSALLRQLCNLVASITVVGVSSGGSTSGPPANAAAILAIASQLQTIASRKVFVDQ